jgi:predicted O-linked N-acetylglucosamine transferase (SPINDLY family)
MNRKERRAGANRPGGGGATALSPAALQFLAQGMQEHQAGRLAEAVADYRAAAALAPGYPEIYNNLGLALFGLGKRDEAVAAYRQAVARKPDFHEAFFNLGLALASLGRAADAVTAYRRAQAIKPDFAETHYNLANALRDLRRFDAAVEAYRRAIRLNPNFADAYCNLGATLQDQGDLDAALAAFRSAAEIDPASPEASNNLGLALFRLDRTDEAAAAFRHAVALRPDFADAQSNLGAALQKRGSLPEAVIAYRGAIAANPNDARAHANLGLALQALGEPDAAAASLERGRALAALVEAAERCERAVTHNPRDALAHLNLGMVRKEQGRAADSLAEFEAAIALQPDLAEAHYQRGSLLLDQGRMDDACEAYRRVLAHDPHHGLARLAICMAQLPIICRTEAEITQHREAYARALDHLCEDAAPEAKVRLAEAVGSVQPFFLAYQGRNDRALQSQYGGLICRLIGEHFPPAPAVQPPQPNEPIRVGIVSGCFWNHSNWKIPIKGWLSQLDRSRFALHGYHLDQIQDDATALARSLCQRFVDAKLSLAEWRETILADRPHVLIYPEIGMHTLAPLLAAQRLAPVQCNSWGHPDTSGFPTLDYYLSSALMEPPDGDDHYTETLIRLPNLSIYYEPVEVEPAPLERRELGLRPGATVYWCCQSLFKYLPQFDDVFPRIAREAGDCQFVFLETSKGRHVTTLFLERLERSFAALGLDHRRYCVVLPHLPLAHFHGAMACCDVFLDSIGWSGCNSTLESLGRDMPIVTLRGNLMRGRHSAAILDMMGLSEIVAERIEDYVALAVRLARDPARRTELGKQIAANKHRIWRDRAAVAGLEDFLERVVRRG